MLSTFRANPRYELVLFDHLPDGERRALEHLGSADLYGVLRPRERSGLSLKAVCRETALLWLTLQQPGALPRYTRSLYGAELDRTVARLVLDGVLEIESGGAFLSGAAAQASLFGVSRADEGTGRIARLSLAALRMGARLDLADAFALADRLYLYNRQPRTPEWRRRLETPESVLTFLGLGPEGPRRRLLDRHWVPIPADPAWFAWGARREQGAPIDRTLRCKLYVSPACEAAGEAVEAVLDGLAPRARCFKFGRDAFGLLRPDKIVAYFRELDELQAAAHRLAERLQGCPAQGVPFTAEITRDGLLSWGVDPPAGAALIGWGGSESWRSWLAKRLASSLIAAAGTAEPWRFALERLRLEGVDTASWIPSQTLWAGAPPGKG